MFEAGALIYRIQTMGAEVFERELKSADATLAKTGTTAKATGKATEELGTKQDGTAKKTKDASKATDELGKSQTTAKQKTDEATKSTERNGKALGGMSEDAKRASREVGQAAVGIGASFIAVAGLSAKAAMDWESQWTGVTKTIDGTPADLAAIEDGLRGLTKILPATHEEIAAVAEAAGQLGVKAASVVAFTRTMVDLGETTNLSSDEAATSIAQLMNIMQTAPGDVDRLGSSLVALGNNGASTEKDIIQMAQRIAGAGKIIGLTEGEVLGFANALASAGIDVEAGGSAISRIMTDIAKQVSTNGEDLEKWASVGGMSAADFSKAFKEDPAQAISTFITGLGKMSAAGGDVFTTLDELGQSDIRVSNALLAMANSGDMLTDSLKLGNQAWEENNALQVEAWKRYQTTDSQMQIAQNRVRDAAIDFGDVLLPVIRDVTDGVGNLADGLGEMDPYWQSTVVNAGLTTGAVLLMGGTMLVAIPKVVELMGSVRALSASMPTLTANMKGAAAFMTGPWGIGIAAAVAGVSILDTYITSLKTSTEEWQNVIRNADSAEDLFTASDAGRFVSQLDQATRSAEDFQFHLDLIANNDFGTGVSLPAQQMKKSLQDLGGQLAQTAEYDLPSAQKSFGLLVDEMKLSEKQQGELLNEMGPYRDALIEQATAQGINVTTDDEALNLKRLLKIATGENATVTDTAAESYGNAAEQADVLLGTLQDLIDEMNISNDLGADAITSNIDYQNVLSDVAEQIENVRKGTEGYGRGISEATQAGRDNKDMLVEQATASKQAAEDQFALDNNTANYMATLQAGRQAMIDNAIALGATKEEATLLADAVYQIPTQRQIDVIAKTNEALLMMQRFKAMVDSIDGSKIVSVGVQLPSGYVTDPNLRKYITVPAKPEADGGRLSFYADGGRSENHIAQFARAGTMRVWAEPETGGEWYIPASPAKRARSTQILSQAAEEFGYALVPSGAQSFADGGRAGAAPASGRGGSTLTGNLYLETGEFLGTVRGVVREELAEEEAAAAAGYSGV